jgi:H+-translocating NAD(P) transhydrogenase subunit alpha
MSATTTIQFFVFLLAGFVGFQTISRIPPLLHTPLMAATNAISGISLVASIVLAGSREGVLATVLGTIAVACAMANVVGGFLITDRMLAMFKRSDGSNEKKAAAGTGRP